MDELLGAGVDPGGPGGPDPPFHRCRNEILIGGGALIWKGMAKCVCRQKILSDHTH